MINENPLRQYFRRPAVFLRLPSNGKYYTEDVIDMPVTGELPVYPMTAIDDITLKTPDSLFNGSAMVDVIKSCVPNIKDPWKINNMDLDAILIAIRSASGDSTLDIESTCPNCNDISTFGIELVNILAQLKAADYDKELEINELKIRFKPLTYVELNQAALAQFEAQKLLNELENLPDDDTKQTKMKESLEKVTNITMSLMSKGIDHIATPTAKVDNQDYILDFLQHCDKNDFAKIRDYLASLRQATELKPLHIKCASCEHEYEQPFTLNTTDFFG